jgi:hypothetical protein
LGALAASRRRFGLVEIILLVGFTFASLRAARQISIWVLIAAPVLCVAVLDIYASLPRKLIFRISEHPPLFARILNAVILVVVALIVLVRVSGVALDQTRAEREFFPAAAVEWLQRQGRRGPIFNLYDWGGYLIWKLYPDERVFIDGRSDLYGLTGDRVVSEYLQTINGGERWNAALEKYKVRLVLVPPDTPLATLLSVSELWQQVYKDDSAVIFERKPR